MYQDLKRENRDPKDLEYFKFHRDRYAKICEIVSKYHEGGALLDVGAQPFHLTEAFLQMGILTRAIDGNLKSRFCDKCDIMRDPIPHPDKSYSMVVLSEVIEHLANPVKPLLEINRVMEMGGVIIVTTPNAYSFGKVAKYLVGKESYSQGQFYNYLQEYVVGYPGHVKEYSKKGLIDLMAYCGFQMTDFSFETYSSKGSKILSVANIIPGFRPYMTGVFKKIKHLDLEMAATDVNYIKIIKNFDPKD